MCHFSQLRTYETLNTYNNRPTDKCVCNSPTATMESHVLSTARERKSKAGAQWSLTLSAETPAPSDTAVGVHGFPKATSQPPTNAYDIGRCTREQQQKRSKTRSTDKGYHNHCLRVAYKGERETKETSSLSLATVTVRVYPKAHVTTTPHSAVDNVRRYTKKTISPSSTTIVIVYPKAYVTSTLRCRQR